MDAGQAHMFETVFNQIGFPMTIIEPNIPRFTIIAMNEARINATAMPADAMIGKDTFDVFKPWDKNSEEQLSLLKNGLIEAVEQKKHVKLPLLYFEIPVPGGTTVQGWAQTELTPIFDSEGKVAYLLSIAKNVTEQELNKLALAASRKKELEMAEELANANNELQNFNEELRAVNEELACTNEELAVTNEQLYTSNELLEQSRESLQLLNTELEDRILKRTKALADSETRFRTMFETISQMAWTVDNNAEATFFNKRWYDYTGLDFEASKGYGWKEAMHPDDVEAALNKFRDMQLGLSDGGGFENRIKGTDGEFRWHLTRMVPVKNEEGETEMWIGTATEINQLKELQQQKDDFISIASHELKTPMTSLKGSLQLLERLVNNLTSPMLPKLIAQSSRSMHKITALVEDLLNLSRINQDRLQLTKSAFVLSKIVSAGSSEIRLAEEYKIIVTGDLELEVFADEHQIDQVLVNFINNAVKYAPRSKDIIVSIEKINDMARVSVTDKGPGIHPDEVKRIFERYYRVETAGFQTGGLGLGLYISAEIIKKHEGRIGVESEPGKGSTFWFTIPIEI
ncbi:ATP-binding protein [Mucilaginibacter sp. AW1-7]|uniref:ATP-binding protein n=1 Tax=Mucilaginibacter sp. AW1-7 TaxID=3349874 RepID=UPI003F73F474